MCELYNCILDVQCHLKLWMTCQIWTYKVHEECQTLGHEGALGLPDVVFFKFCCTVLKSSTNCTTWALWDRSDFWFSAILAASVFSFSMAAWSWEYSPSDIPHLTKTHPVPMCCSRWIHHNRITSTQYQKGSYILPKKSVSQQPVALSHLICCNPKKKR